MTSVLFKNAVSKQSLTAFTISLLLSLLITNEVFSNPLIVNEFLAVTDNTDRDGTPLEWIEIFNAGKETVILGDYALTDDPQSPRKWVLPSIGLESGQLFIVWATGYDRYVSGKFHTNFRLDGDGEYLAIVQSDGSVVDSLTFPEQRQDVSFGRNPNDRSEWFYFANPTPGETNATQGILAGLSPPSFIPPGGFYSNQVKVSLSTRNEDWDIYYTLDGSPPTQTSKLYQTPLNLSKSTSIRARVFRDGAALSDEAIQTTIIETAQPLPIVSFVTDPPNLWNSRTGIYANATSSGFSWERPVSMEYISRAGLRRFGVNAGLRIHGGASRKRSEKKSFRVYFRREYGPGKLHESIIPSTNVDEFDSFILRAGYNDSWVHWDAIERQVAVYVSDQLGRNIQRDMGFIAPHGDYVDLYLNGDYWGIYNLCERIDGDYLESYYGYDDWDIINDDELKEGDRTSWNAMKNFVNRSNFTQSEPYQTIQTMIDLEQVTAYHILNIWVQNHDWPHHNWYAVRERRDDGKWKFICWDIEDSFGSGASRGQYNLNTFNQAKNNNPIGNLFAALTRNPEYKIYFVQQLEHYLGTALSEEHLLNRLEEQLDLIRDAIPNEALRWNRNKSIDDWEKAAEMARTFINNRTEYVRRYVYRGLKIATPTPTPNPAFTPTPTPNPAFTPTPTPTPTSTPNDVVVNPDGELGIFEGHDDIGTVDATGSASFDPVTGDYTVVGSGADIWGNTDEFHFLYTELDGSFTVEAEIDASTTGGSNWAKALLMARDTLDHQAKNYAARIRESDAQASSQWRLGFGQTSSSTPGSLRIDRHLFDGRLRLVREGDEFSTYYFSTADNAWTYLDGQEVDLDDPIYVGLAVTSHEDGSYAEGIFTNVILKKAQTGTANWYLY